ncbi:SDR family NAD(P)-dependent oxidoreductase [Kribbella sp. NBC_00359]|uniref:SDR family NAD(P)-dependent oxidoreductase n=1 Tax=Kribbella sp. NBC_00359 TaxID=2975966 RepID=UPI002E2245DF
MILTGKVAIVTGASQGIGAATAVELAARGAIVAVNVIDEQHADDAAAVVKMIQADGGEAFVVQADLRDEDQIRNLIRTTVGEAGGLNILVNNAGVFSLRLSDEVDVRHLRDHFDVNVYAAVLTTRHAVSHFDAGDRVIHVSSGLARRIAKDCVAYAATKGALESVTRVQAAELGPRGVTVNAVAPGIVDTSMLASTLTPDERRGVVGATALGRVGQPRDIARVIAFLASEDSGWITGQIIPVNGGLA